MKKYFKQSLLTAVIAIVFNQVLHIIDPQGSYSLYAYLFTGSVAATIVFFFIYRK